MSLPHVTFCILCKLISLKDKSLITNCLVLFPQVLQQASLSFSLSSIALILAITSVLSTSTGTLWKSLDPSISLELSQINMDLYETWNLSFWGPIWLIPLILAIPSVLSMPPGTLWSHLYPYTSAKAKYSPLPTKGTQPSPCLDPITSWLLCLGLHRTQCNWLLH